jgi:hypothetical protein
VQTKLARFTKRVVTLAQKAVVGNAKPALQRGDGGYADWVIVSIHGLKMSPNLPYRRLLNVLYEMPRIGRILGLDPTELPDFTDLYQQAKEGKIENFIGVNHLFQEPLNPEIIINTDENHVEECVAEAMSKLNALNVLDGGTEGDYQFNMTREEESEIKDHLG